MIEPINPQELERLRNLEPRGTNYTVAGYKALLAEVDRLTAELDEVTDLDRSALKLQELRDERARAVAAWHEQKKRADAAEARVAKLEAEHGQGKTEWIVKWDEPVATGATATHCADEQQARSLLADLTASAGRSGHVKHRLVGTWQSVDGGET